TASTNNNTANLSDATVYAFLANHPHGSHLVHKDLEQIHEDDLEEMDLKWELALLSTSQRYNASVVIRWGILLGNIEVQGTKKA
ncbi:hypothetical protein Tco_0501225, partial [Tanacetum coccineum]